MRDVASFKNISTVGEYDRINQQRYITVTANLHNKDIGSAIKDVNKVINSLDSIPTGMKIYQRGQADVFSSTFSEFQNGILLAVIAILLSSLSKFPLNRF